MKGMGSNGCTAYFSDALKWLKQRHGGANVVYSGVHRDEETRRTCTPTWCPWTSPPGG